MSNMPDLKKSVIVTFILCVSVCIDQATKELARTSLGFSRPLIYFGDLIRLQYTENPGGMLSFGADLSEGVRFWLLTVFVGLLLLMILIIIFANRHLSSGQVAALSLIVGGGVSNLLDRIFNNGLVIDFINLGIDGLRTGIFNAADVIILAGTAVLIVVSSFQTKPDVPTSDT